jgi:AcrR family transcriptional regulator
VTTRSPAEGASHEPTTRELVRRAAYASFVEVGYTRTTYQRIADRIGRDRALVQYHVPKKERLAVEFLGTLLERAESSLLDHDLVPDREPVAYRFVLAQLYFATLSANQLRGFTADILEIRTIVEELVDYDVAWNVAFVEPTPDERQTVVDDTVMGIGGAYELLYRRLREGRATEPTDLARRTLQIGLPQEHRNDPSVPALLDRNSLPADLLSRSAQEILTATVNYLPQPKG